MNIRLRRARQEDGPDILFWRNDPETVRRSLNTRRVNRAEHARWFAERLSRREPALFIISSNGQSAGQVRLDFKNRKIAEVSITVAPSFRGRGIAALALRACVKQAQRLGARRLTARIKIENLPSVIAFLRAGFIFSRASSARTGALYTMVRSLGTRTGRRKGV